MSNASAAPVGGCVNRGVHLHVAVAVKVDDHDHVEVNAGQRQRGRRPKKHQPPRVSERRLTGPRSRRRRRAQRRHRADEEALGERRLAIAVDGGDPDPAAVLLGERRQDRDHRVARRAALGAEIEERDAGRAGERVEPGEIELGQCVHAG
jgi:hypothetical protein